MLPCAQSQHRPQLLLQRREGGPDHPYRHWGGLNHIGLVVEDLEAVETSVRAAGYTPHSHADYEPGRRFYFDDDNGIEFEVVAYD